MALKGISSKLKDFCLFFVRMHIHLLLIITISLALIASLCITGYLWASSGNLDVNGAQVALTLMVFSLYIHLNCCLVATAGLVVPIKFMPFSILVWFSVNIPRSLTLLDSMAGFDRVLHTLPSYQYHRLVHVIWTEGSNEHLGRGLAILFVWWLFGLISLILGIRKRYYRL